MYTGEITQDGLKVYYSIDEGELLIDYMYEYGVEVTSYDQWDKLLERASKIAMADYMEYVEEERAEAEITHWENTYDD